MSAYEIEYVPMPQKVASSEIYPWNQMVIGNSVFLPCAGAAEFDRVRHHVRYSAQVNKVKIATRVEPGGLRVWLTGFKGD